MAKVSNKDFSFDELNSEIDKYSFMGGILNENDFWEIIEQLKAAGAQGILVVPIEKMIVQKNILLIISVC